LKETDEDAALEKTQVASSKICFQAFCYCLYFSPICHFRISVTLGHEPPDPTL